MVRIAQNSQMYRMKIENLFEKRIDRGLIMYYYNKQVERVFGKGEKLWQVKMKNRKHWKLL